jgi:hypothetical protein
MVVGASLSAAMRLVGTTADSMRTTALAVTALRKVKGTPPL